MRERSGITILCGIINIILLLIIPISNVMSNSNEYEQFQQDISEKYSESINVLSSSNTLHLTDEQIDNVQFGFMLFGNEATRLSQEKKYGQHKVNSILEKYPDGEYLYNYTNALMSYNGPIKEVPEKIEYQGNKIQYHRNTFLHQPTTKELKEAIEYLDKIPDDYHGTLADKIKHDKAIIKSQAAEMGIK